MTRIERIAPSRMSFRGFDQDVVSVTAFPPGQHKTSPIIDTLTGVRFANCRGDYRWHGFADAFIGSDLRMHVILAPGQERDEVLMSWDAPQGS